MSQTPYAAPMARVTDPQGRTLGWKQAIPLWWSFFWRTLVYGLLFGFVLGAFSGGIAGFLGVPEKAAFYGGIAGWVATFPATMLALKQSVSRHLTQGVLRAA